MASRDPEVLDPEDTREVSALTSPLEAQTRGEIDIQIATAKRYPRSLKDVRNEAMTLVQSDADTAAACFYTLKRKDKDGQETFIKGGSARLAEIMAYSFGHMRIDARIVAEDDRFITARGVAWDLQKNVAIGYEVRRRISGRYGKYSDDMISVTANAASSIALRNAVFKVIPKPIWEPVYKQALKTAVGEGRPMAERRQKILERFKTAFDIGADRVFEYLGIKGIEDMTIDHIADLIGVGNAIKEGEVKIEEQFPIPPKEPQRASEGDDGKGSARGSARGSRKAKDAGDAKASKGDDAKGDPAPAPGLPMLDPTVHTVTGAKIVSVEFDPDQKWHDVEAQHDDTIRIYVTRDKELAAAAASIADSDHTGTFTWGLAVMRDGKEVPELRSFEVDAPKAKPTKD